MPKAKLKIIWENDDLLVLDKPVGLDVYELLEIVVKKYPGALLIHRLDRDTSGVLLVAKNEASQKYFQQQFKARAVIKHYRAIVYGKVKRETGSIELAVGRSRQDPRKRVAGREAMGQLREAKTAYQVIKYFKGYTYLEAALMTGRTHQLRVHFQAIGHPIVGDKLYLPKDKTVIEKLALPQLDRQALHSYYLKITLPSSLPRQVGQIKEFTAPLPADFQAALDYLEEKC